MAVIFESKHMLRQRGAAAVLAMMFMVIFSSLAASMAIVSQGNYRTADTHLKINRASAAAETGLQYLLGHLQEVATTIQTSSGLIEGDIASDLWYDEADPLAGVAYRLVTELTGASHNVSEPLFAGGVVYIGPIDIGIGSPEFSAEIVPHPIAGENYDADWYQQEPYANYLVSSLNPLDSSWIRLRVTATDGFGASAVSRTLEIDCRMAKRIRYAILSRSRVMLGRNVMVEGPIGSTFNEVDLENGHPVQMVSDFEGLNSDLDNDLQTLLELLIDQDQDNDNRLNTGVESEINGIADPESLDVSGDGYIDEFDLFLGHFDEDGNGRITQAELELLADDPVTAGQLFELMDTAGTDQRVGYGDGYISADDRYAKVQGTIYISASIEDWEAEGHAANRDGGGAYQEHLTGAIRPDYKDSALESEASKNEEYEFTPDDFDVSDYYAMTETSLASYVPKERMSSPEAVPYGSPNAYDYYYRPVYRGEVFTNLFIPKGMNPLFEDCVFVGVVFVESERNNIDDNYNYAGMIDRLGNIKHKDLTVEINSVEYLDTKVLGNNIRFHQCEFHGSVVTSAPRQYTHVRNKLTFTGVTKWQIDDSPHLSDEQKAIFRRSALLAPHFSVEMGTFSLPANDLSSEKIELSGSIVAGLIDLRGQIDINGQILTTFQPVSNTMPVIGETSPQFNTTLGYFPQELGDLEADDLPVTGLGRIRIRYNPNMPLPDGILGPIEIQALWSTYRERGI